MILKAIKWTFESRIFLSHYAITTKCRRRRERTSVAREFDVFGFLQVGQTEVFAVIQSSPLELKVNVVWGGVVRQKIRYAETIVLGFSRLIASDLVGRTLLYGGDQILILTEIQV